MNTLSSLSAPITITTTPTVSTFQSPTAPYSPAYPHSPITPIATPICRLYESSTNLALEYGTTAVADDQKVMLPDKEDEKLGISSYSTETETTTDTIVLQNGYRCIRKISDTLQGAIYEAVITDPQKRSKEGMQTVAIKQTSKRLHKQKESQQDAYGSRIIVQENILKEIAILKHLTKDNTPNGGYIARYIEHFDSDKHFYLVTEYVGDCNLAQFTEECHQLIAQNKLNPKRYKQVIRFIFWQISVMIHYMHKNMLVCHLDLCLENIIVCDTAFIMQENGDVLLNSEISVKIADFGLAEIFHPSCSTFSVAKWGLKNSFETTAPQVYAEYVFDGMKADIWSAGVLLYQLLTGQSLYTIPDKGVDAGFSSACRGELILYIHLKHLNKYFTKKSLQLIVSMLNVDESKRIDALDVLQSPWFAPYYQQYERRIEKQSELQKVRLKVQQDEMASLPYYGM